MLSLFVNDILYRKNPEDSTKKKELRKLKETNTQKSVTFLYVNNDVAAMEIKKTISFTLPSKRMKYLGINLTKR